MDLIAKFLEQQPILALFLVIGGGYAFGRINIKGLELGVGAVIFAGLLVGWISPKSQPPAMLGTLGLVLFLYAIGIAYGRQFFAGLASKTGLRYNLLALFSLGSATALTVALMVITKTPKGYMAGLFSGSTTTAAAMMAAIDTVKNTDPAIGYSVALPFGILGTILAMHFMQVFVKPKIDVIQKNIQTREVKISDSDIAGTTVASLLKRLPPSVRIFAVRTQDENRLPNPEYLLSAEDVLLLGSEDISALNEAANWIGLPAHGHVVTDRSDLDYIRVFASRHQVVGRKLSDLNFPPGVETSVVQLRRGDADLIPAPDLILEYGDRIGLLCHRNHFETIRNFFGDSIRGTTEFSYIALGIGMVLGVIASVIPIPVPGLGTIKLGIAGGVLLVALVLGKLARSGPLTWTMPLSSNLILRTFGISLFLAQVGMSSGERFVGTIQQNGASLLLMGAIILIPIVLFPLLIGHFLMRMPFDDLFGVTSGLAGNAAIVSYASKSFPSDRVEIAYAMIYPGAIILKVIIAQALAA